MRTRMRMAMAATTTVTMAMATKSTFCVLGVIGIAIGRLLGFLVYTFRRLLPLCLVLLGWSGGVGIGHVLVLAIVVGSSAVPAMATSAAPWAETASEAELGPGAGGTTGSTEIEARIEAGEPREPVRAGEVHASSRTTSGGIDGLDEVPERHGGVVRLVVRPRLAPVARPGHDGYAWWVGSLEFGGKWM
jgi:hypothetical protein